MQDVEETILDLRAVIVYLHVVGAVYPIAPEQAIKTIERTISFLSPQLETMQDETKAP